MGRWGFHVNTYLWRGRRPASEIPETTIEEVEGSFPQGKFTNSLSDVRPELRRALLDR
jgi:hypothetical protein